MAGWAAIQERLHVGGFIVGLLMLASCQPATSPAAPKNLTIVVSCDTAGWMAPCGCSVKQSGGLLRRATFINDVRKSSNVIVADAGGAPGGTSEYDRLKFEAILKGELLMGVAAHNIGAAEARLGAAELARLAQELRCPFITSNLRDRGGTALGEPYRIVSMPGIRVAILGVLSPSLAPAALEADEPRSAVLQTAAAIKGQYDVLLVLAYLSDQELEEFASKLPEADLIVGGPTGQSITPRRSGPTLWAAATNKGKFLAKLERSANDSAWSGSIVELGPEWDDDAAQAGGLKAFRKRLEELDLPAERTSFVTAIGSGGENFEIAGSTACKECHSTEWESWSASPHAHARESLTESYAPADSYCQSCHSTGYGLPGGFESLARSSDLFCVGCESCHGPSLAHAQSPSSHTPYQAADRCAHCHDHENSPKFEFEAYWSKVRHGPSIHRKEGGR